MARCGRSNPRAARAMRALAVLTLTLVSTPRAASAALVEDLWFAGASASNGTLHAGGSRTTVPAEVLGTDDVRLSTTLVADGVCENQANQRYLAAIHGHAPEACTLHACAAACDSVHGCKFFEFAGYHPAGTGDAPATAGLCACHIKTSERVDACDDALPQCCGTVNATIGGKTFRLHREGMLPDVVFNNEGVKEFEADPLHSAGVFYLNGSSGVDIGPSVLANFGTRDQRPERDFGVDLVWQSQPDAVRLTMAEDTGRTVAARYGVVQDGYADSYASNLHHEITVMGRDCGITWKYLDVENGTRWYTGQCPYDYVEINSFDHGPYVGLEDEENPPRRIQKFCEVEGNLPPPLQLKGNGFKVVFHTNEDTEYRGFVFEFRCGVAAETPVPAALSDTPAARSVAGTPPVDQSSPGRVLWSRGDNLWAKAYANGVLDFKYYSSRCVTLPATFRFDAWRKHRVDFRRSEGVLYVTLDGEQVCRAPVHDNLRMVAVDKGDYQVTMGTNPVSGVHERVSHHPSESHGCHDDDVLASFQGTAYTRANGGVNLCSARCFATFQCRYFRVGVADSDDTCELLRDCGAHASYDVGSLVTNASQLTKEVYHLTPGSDFGVDTVAEGGWYQLRIHAFCVASATAFPAVGGTVIGQRCTPAGDAKDILWAQMFHLDPTGTPHEFRLRSVYDSSLCITCDPTPGLPKTTVQCVFKPCTVSAAFYREPQTRMLQQVGTTGPLCLEHVDLVRNGVLQKEVRLGLCRGTAFQKSHVTASPRRRIRYIWKHESGMLKWEYEGDSVWPYQPTERGLQPTPNPRHNVTSPPIPAHPTPRGPPPARASVVRSPPVCGPLASVHVWVFGYGGNATAAPGEPGFLGVILRDISTGQVFESYQLPDNTEFPGIEVKWSWDTAATWGNATDTPVTNPPCYVMELYDHHEHAIGIHDADFVLAGRTETLHCQEYAGVHLRMVYGTSQVHIAEFAAYDPLGNALGATFTASSGTGNYGVVADNDASTWYTNDVGGEEYMSAIWTPSQVGSIDITLGCPGGDTATCYAMQANFVVEVLAADGVTVALHMRTLAFHYNDTTGAARVTLRLCGEGVHVPTLPLSGDGIAACIDDAVDSLKSCDVVSRFISPENYFMKIDLLYTMPVAAVRWFTSRVPRIRGVWVGDNAAGPNQLGNAQCMNVTEEGLEPPCETCYLTNFRADIACNLVGRYVYVVADKERGLHIHEIDVFVPPYDLYNHPALVNGPYIFKSAPTWGLHTAFPYHLGAVEKKSGTWATQTFACGLEPVQAIEAFDFPCSLNVDVVLSTSRNPDADTTALRYHLTNSYQDLGNTYYQWGAGNAMSQAKAVDGCVAGTTFRVYRKRQVVYYQLEGSTTAEGAFPVNTTQPLYGCVRVTTPSVQVSYVATPCPPDDEVCTGAMAAFTGVPLSIVPDTPGVLSDVRVEQTPSLVTVPVRKHVARTGTGDLTLYPDPFYGGIPERTMPGPVWEDGYVITPRQDDACAGLDGVWIEFNVTEDAWVTLFFDRPAARPWLAVAGWKLLSPLDAARAAPKVHFNVRTHSFAAVRHVVAGELVQVQGSHAEGSGDVGLLKREPLASPVYVFVHPDAPRAPAATGGNATNSSSGSTGGPHSGPYSNATTPPAHIRDTPSSLMFYETFDQYFGECATKDVINPGDAFRTASSFLWGLNTPGQFYHKGTLDRDNSSAWTAEDRGVVGDWYQIEYNPTGSNESSLIIGVIIQGKDKAYAPDESEWVTSFSVKSSEDGVTFKDVDGGFVFEGNNDPRTHARRYFSNPVYARFVRIYPVAWHKGMSLRAALVKCGFPLPLHTGLQLTGGCLAEVSNDVKVEGMGALHLQSPCTANATIEFASPGVNPTHIGIWGRSTQAEVARAWVLALDIRTEDGEVEVFEIATTGPSGALSIGGVHTGLRVFNDTWFSFFMSLTHDPRDPSIIVNAQWTLNTLPEAVDMQPPPGISTGILPVRWRAVTKAVFSKEVEAADSYFDGFEIWGAEDGRGGMGHHPQIFSFDEVDLMDPARRCGELVSYRSDGDYELQRLTALHRPYLLRDHCIEECCLHNWCTGVMVPHAVANTTRGCYLLRQGFAVPHPSAPATGGDTYYLKLTVVDEAPGARRYRHAPEIPEQALRSYPEDDVADALSVGTEQLFVGGRGHPSVAYTYKLEVKGSFNGVTPEVLIAGLTARESAGPHAAGFNALRDEILPVKAAVDMAAFPPFVDVHLYSTPNYTIPGDEVVVFSLLEADVLGVSDATVFSRGGRMFGLNRVQPLTVRANAECNGTRVCGGRRCECGTQECREAYVCSCEYPPDDLTSMYGQFNSSAYRAGDDVFVHEFAEGVEQIQTDAGLWDPSFAAYLGQRGEVVSVREREPHVVTVVFGDATQHEVHARALVATNGIEICKFTRRPPGWVH